MLSPMANGSRSQELLRMELDMIKNQGIKLPQINAAKRYMQNNLNNYNSVDIKRKLNISNIISRKTIPMEHSAKEKLIDRNQNASLINLQKIELSPRVTRSIDRNQNVRGIPFKVSIIDNTDLSNHDIFNSSFRGPIIKESHSVGRKLNLKKEIQNDFISPEKKQTVSHRNFNTIDHNHRRFKI